VPSPDVHDSVRLHNPPGRRSSCRGSAASRFRSPYFRTKGGH